VKHCSVVTKKARTAHRVQNSCGECDQLNLDIFATQWYKISCVPHWTGGLRRRWNVTYFAF
jgi:hypothetical protein